MGYASVLSSSPETPLTPRVEPDPPLRDVRRDVLQVHLLRHDFSSLDLNIDRFIFVIQGLASLERSIDARLAEGQASLERSIDARLAEGQASLERSIDARLAEGQASLERSIDARLSSFERTMDARLSSFERTIGARLDRIIALLERGGTTVGPSTRRADDDDDGDANRKRRKRYTGCL
jgi:hypothetical protein